MKRYIVFIRDSGKLPEALGVSDGRMVYLDALVGGMISENRSLRDVLEYLNEEEDLTDAEWTSVVYALGYYAAGIGL